MVTVQIKWYHSTENIIICVPITILTIIAHSNRKEMGIPFIDGNHQFYRFSPSDSSLYYHIITILWRSIFLVNIQYFWCCF